MNLDEQIAEQQRRLDIMLAVKKNPDIPVETHHRAAPESGWLAVLIHTWNWNKYDYRLKAAPKYRPWTVAEIPLGAVVRTKRKLNHSSGDSGIMCRVRYGQVDIAGQSVLIQPEILLAEFLVSYDFCKTWQPCGVLES